MCIVITKENLIHNISFSLLLGKIASNEEILHFSNFLITIPNIFFWQSYQDSGLQAHTTAEKSMHTLPSPHFPAKTPIYSVAWKLKFQLLETTYNFLHISHRNSLKPTAAKTTEFPCFGSHHFPQHKKPLLPRTFLRSPQGWCPPEHTACDFQGTRSTAWSQRCKGIQFQIQQEECPFRTCSVF